MAYVCGMLGCVALLTLSTQQKTPLKNDLLIVALGGAYIVQMQLVDAILWTESGKGTALNRAATSIGQILVFTQPVVLYGLSIHFGRRRKIPPFLHISMVCYACLTLVCTWNAIRNRKRSLTNWNNESTRCFPDWDTGILDTKGVSKYVIGPMHMILLPTLAFYAMETSMLKLLHPLSLAGTLVASFAKFRKESVGRFWCYFAPFVYLPMAIPFLTRNSISSHAPLPHQFS